jgi:hypothetical protein
MEIVRRAGLAMQGLPLGLQRIPSLDLYARRMSIGYLVKSGAAGTWRVPWLLLAASAYLIWDRDQDAGQASHHADHHARQSDDRTRAERNAARDDPGDGGLERRLYTWASASQRNMLMFSQAPVPAL